MRRWIYPLATGLLSLLFASQASSLPYSGVLQLTIGTLPSFVVPGSGDGVSTPTAVGIGPNANFITTVTVPVSNATNGTLPAFPIVNLALTGPAGLTVANFAAGGGQNGGMGGDAGLAGFAKVGLFGPPPVAFLTVPLSVVGVAGASVSRTGIVDLTAFGSSWTTGQVQIIGTNGRFDGVVLTTTTGADNRTAGGAGQIVLVSPNLVRTQVIGSENLPVVGRLTLNFVPEPGTLMLLGSGIAGLALLGRRNKASA